MRVFSCCLVTLLAVALAPEAAGQFAQYTAPGGPGAPATSRRQEIETSLEEARFRLGPVRLAPWFGLSNVSYVNNVLADGGDDDTGDLTATLGAGLMLLVPTGPKTVWTVEGAIEHVYWNDLDERSRTGGRAGAAVFGFYNRLQLELGAGLQETEQYASDELPQRLPFRTEHARGSATVQLSRKIDLWGRARAAETTSLADEIDDPRVPDFGVLDRDETVLAAGLGWSPTDQVRLGLGAERSEVGFAEAARDLSNEGTSPVVTLDLIGNRVELRLQLARRELEPTAGSAFVPFESETGSAQVDLDLSERLDLQLYGRRGLVYSIEPGYGYFTDQRAGATVRMPLGRRLGLSFFAEVGENDYTADDPAIPDRADDVTSYGGNLSFELGKYLSFTVGGRQTDYDSSLPGLDRSVGAIETGLTLRFADSLIWR
jgi:hypothetical protein